MVFNNEEFGYWNVTVERSLRLRVCLDRTIPADTFKKAGEYDSVCTAIQTAVKTVPLDEVRGIIEGFWRLYTDDFNTIVLPVPPIEEQAEIMKYIIEFRDKTKRYENSLTQEISTLQEFKDRLISDVVIGKIDVRGIEVPGFEYVEETGDSFDEDEEDIGDAFEDEEE